MMVMLGLYWDNGNKIQWTLPYYNRVFIGVICPIKNWGLGFRV